jgi:transposase
MTLFMKSLVKSNKNDFLDAEAIAEAVERQNMRFVPLETDDQLDLQSLHRVRKRLVVFGAYRGDQPTARLPVRTRYHLPQGAEPPLCKQIPEILENANENL